MARPAEEPRHRFLKFIEEVDSGCIVWTSTKNRQGYGKFFYKNKQYPAHRASLELFNGIDAGSDLVLHKCDNPSCVNPEHLYVGTHKQNVKDAMVRDRWVGHVRLSARTVREIKERYAFGGITQQKLADEYGIHQTQVSKYVLEKQRA